MKIEDKYFKEFTLKIEDVDVLNESIYNQLARNMAKLADIDFAKTPVVDLFTGYQRGLVLQQRIDKAIDLLDKEYESCEGALTNPEHTIISKHDLLKNEINSIRKVIEILKGDNNENS